MPSFNTEGKSKEDLAIVAQLAGLLTLEQTSKMSRAEIARVIDRENRKQEAEAKAALVASAGGSKIRGRKAAAKAEPAAEPEEKAPEAPVKKKPGRRAAATKPAAETLPVQEVLVEKATDALAAELKPSRRVKKQAAGETAAAAAEPAAGAAPVSETLTAVTVIPEAAVAKNKPGRKKSSARQSAEAVESAVVSVDASAEISAEQPKAEILSEPAAEALAEQTAETGETPSAEALVPARKTGGRRKAAKAAYSTDSQIEISQTAEKPAAAVSELPSSEKPAADEIDASAEVTPESESDAEIIDASLTRPGHHLPPRHTLTPAKPGQRRTRIIGAPDKEQQGKSHKSDRIQQKDNNRKGRNVRQIRPVESAHAEDEAETAVEEAVVQTGAAASAAPAHETAAAGHRPAVEAGDVQAGILEIMPDGYGFLRKENYLQGNKDIYVPPQYIRRFGLRAGDLVSGPVKLQRENDRYQALLYIKEVNGMSPEKMIRRPHFDRLTPIYPNERFVLETVRNELSTRIIDLVAPIGKGQRGMIVSPPKAGKTILLQKIANAISVNNPDVKLIVLLIDERPEEVTDMQRSIKGEVVYSTFDKTPENHTKVTELVLERAMRLVELKQDVVILLDSMTRLARAYNLSINPTGRTLSGGLDPGALYGPKRFFGAARNIENGGSLTIIATSLIETGSRMDEVIFEEFKGTGNMEVYLDRKMSEKRIFPAIDINKSGTRREELLMTSRELDAVWTIRKAFGQLDTTAVTEAIINLLLKTTNNEHFISSVNVSFNDKNVFEAMRGVRPSEAAQSSQGGQQGRGGNYGGYNNSGYNSSYRRNASNDDD